MFRSAASSLPVTLRQMGRVGRLGRLALAGSAVALLSACGGGDRAEPFQPDRVVVFGDENSAFAPDETVGSAQIKGLVYTVNTVAPVEAKICVGADLGDPVSACATADTTTTYYGFVMDDLTKPLGTGAPYVGAASYPNSIRMVGLGDAWLNADGSSTAPAKLDRVMTYFCDDSQIAAQRIAHNFGKGFADKCPRDNAGAKTYAAAGAKIADLQAQVNQAIGEGQLRKGSLAIVWIGQNDIIALAEDATTYVLQADKLYQAKLRADSLAQVVKQIYRTGAKVIVVGVPGLGYSPWAVELGGATACDNTQVQCNLSVQALVDGFNQTLKRGDRDTGIKGLQDFVKRGRDYTFVDAADIVRSYALSASYTNTRGVCAGSKAGDSTAWTRAVKPDGTLASLTAGVFEVQYCSGLTLVDGASAGAYVWADDRHLTPAVHSAIAGQALVHAVNHF